MAKKQNYYYVLVMTGHGPVFVTSVNNTDKVAHWDGTEAPKELGKYRADDLAMGLTLNGNVAFTVCAKYELETQPYMYSKGQFVWKYVEEVDT